MEEIKTFFTSDLNWLFLAGHFSGGTLYNDAEYRGSRSGNVKVRFLDNGVDVSVGRAEASLRKSDGTFTLQDSCMVILWGGCSTLGVPEDVNTMRALFDKPLMLGFSGRTGWRIVSAMLGADFIKPPNAFFDRISKPEDLIQVRKAWMDTAKWGYGGNAKIENIFRACDPDGKEWRL